MINSVRKFGTNSHGKQIYPKQKTPRGVRFDVVKRVEFILTVPSSWSA